MQCPQQTHKCTAAVVQAEVGGICVSQLGSRGVRAHREGNPWHSGHVVENVGSPLGLQRRRICTADIGQ